MDYDKVKLVGVDLDKCLLDGILAPWAADVVTRLESYTEITPSNTGLRTFVFGDIPTDGKKKSNIEIYKRGRFLTVTGNHWPGTPQTIENRPGEILSVYLEYFPDEQEVKPANRHIPTVIDLADDELIKKAKSARNGAKFTHLWDGNTSDYPSPSEVHLALCSFLAFWTGGDAQRMDRLFRQSALYPDAHKWDKKHNSDGKTYGQMTIDKALANTVDYYRPANGKSKSDVPTEAILTEKEENSFLLDEGIDDEGNAQCLVAMFPNKFLYCPAYGYMYYNGKNWQADSEAIADRHIVKMLKARRIAAVKADYEPLVKFAKSNANRLHGCKELLKSLIIIDMAKFDSSPELLNCANGVIDLRTGQLHPHSPSQLFTYCLSVEYDPQADTSAWQKWILETVGSESVANYLKLAVGYTLTGFTSEECLFYIQGPTRSGKGTFTETLLALLGKPLSTEVDFMTFTSKRDADANNFDLAPLKATRFVAASESTDYDFLNDRRIKTLTGGNHISCAFKHKDFFSYRPQFKVWLSSNKPVKANASDDAIWIRVKVIQFPHSHAGKEDKSLKRRFLSLDNLKAVLTWAVQGATEWFALPRGLESPPEVARETQKQRDSNDYIGRFLEECTEEKDGIFTPNDVIKPVYRAWCEANMLKPRERELANRLTAEYLADKAYLSQPELDEIGYSGVVKLNEGVKTKEFRGYHGLIIPEYILSEYLC